MTHRQKLSLEERLKAWDEAARPNRGNRSWLRYTAAAGSALAMATDAGAGSIAYSGIQNKNVSVSQSTGITFGPASFGLGMSSFNFGTAVGANLHPNSNGVLGSGFIQKLASGSAISGGAGTFNGSVIAQFAIGKHFGYFAAGQSGFAGVEFNTGTAGNPHIHYGWVRLVYSGDPWINSLTAIDWAYETTPGLAIHAGQTAEQSGIPEPGTAALSLLALGAAGVLALRRRIRG